MTGLLDLPRESVIECFGLMPASAAGLHGTTALFERVVDGLSRLITRQREPKAEMLRFPPVTSRFVVEKSGYLHSFPHLLGCVSCLEGDEAAVRRSVERRDWDRRLAPTDLVLTPAACYPVYPLAAERGPLPSEGVLFDVASYCFRREASHELGRFQSFRMREFVSVASPDAAIEFRSQWMTRAETIARDLCLPFVVAPASDPFFGRAGKLMALSQVEQSLKYELLVPIRGEAQPLACMSFNCHREHFGAAWNLRLEDGAMAHSACVAFGMERLALAIFATHGVEPERWPAPTRAALAL